MRHAGESKPNQVGGEEVRERSPVDGVDGIAESEISPCVRESGGLRVRFKRLRKSRESVRYTIGSDSVPAPDQCTPEVVDFGGGGSEPAGGDSKLGGELIGDADTQALVGDVARGNESDSSSVEVDLRDAADFDDAGSGAERFRPEFEYYNGWSEGDDVVLMRRDPRTGKRIKEVHPFEWYFYVRRGEYDRVPREKWAWLARRHARRVIPDPKFPDEYVRVYVRNSVRKLDLDRIFRGIGDPEWGPKWAVPLFLGERPRSLRLPRDRNAWTDLHHAVNWCVRNGVEPLEADLSPKQRLMTDFDVRIQAKYRVGFFDLETDDSVGGFDRKEEARILSVAWEGDRVDEDPKDRGFLLLEEESDEAERELLVQFKRKCLEKYDVVVAWNGAGFDFPVLINRFRLRKVRVEWRRHLFLDLLPIFKRHFVRAGAKAQSFALDAIGEKVLGMRKFDWRSTFRERNRGVPATFLNLYRHEPKLLEEYNWYDVEITRKLEEFTGFAAIEQLFCRISSGFVNDLQIMTKVDQLLLKKGYKEGHHFRTRYWMKEEPERYEGAYVFDPIVGMHENVCVFDFKSLYPSMIRAFNISPETIVRKEERDDFEVGRLCRIPHVTLDRVDEGEFEGVRKGGTTFRTDREGFISQMYERTLERRSKYTKLQGERLKVCGTTQDELYLLYYRLAYSFKRLGLSFYGDLGNPKSRYYDVDLAEAVTLSGQYFIRKTNEYAKKCGYSAIYGDTDSIFVRLSNEGETWENDELRLNDLIARAERFVVYCQERYAKLLEEHGCKPEWNTVYLEFEDIHDRIFFTSKKRYAGKQLYHKGERTSHVEVKGFEVMRSDTSQVARELQRRVLDAVLMENLSAEELERGIVEPEFERAASGKLTAEEVTISKGISRDPDRYKANALHVDLAREIRDHGREFHLGMKVEYVVTGSKPKLSGVLASEYAEDSSLTYDAGYYWDSVIFPPTLRILEVVHPSVDWRGYLLEVRRRRRTLMERYRKWLRDPKRVVKAVEQIRANAGNVLSPKELEELRAVPRVRALKLGEIG